MAEKDDNAFFSVTGAIPPPPDTPTTAAFPPPEEPILNAAPLPSSPDYLTEDNIGKMAKTEYSVGPHTHYWLRSDYIYTVGQYPLPPAGPSGATRIVTLHAPTMFRVVSWACRRVGALPLMPSPEAPDSNHVLLQARISPMAPGLIENMRDGEYWCGGEYHYQMLTPVWDNTAAIAGVSFGVMPWTTLELSDQIVDAANFVTGLF